MKIKYVGPFDAVEVPVGPDRFVVVESGGVIDLPVALAGRPPSKEYLELVAELEKVHADHHARAAVIEQLAGVDVGEGLLAQPSNWEPAAPAKETKS
jgi:hypothetical protein